MKCAQAALSCHVVPLEGDLFFQVAERTPKKSSRKLASRFKPPQTITATWRGMRAERNRLRGYSCNTIRYCTEDHDDIFKALPFTDAEGQSLWKRKIIHKACDEGGRELFLEVMSICGTWNIKVFYPPSKSSVSCNKRASSCSRADNVALRKWPSSCLRKSLELGFLIKNVYAHIARFMPSIQRNIFARTYN